MAVYGVFLHFLLSDPDLLKNRWTDIVIHCFLGLCTCHVCVAWGTFSISNKDKVLMNDMCFTIRSNAFVL